MTDEKPHDPNDTKPKVEPETLVWLDPARLTFRWAGGSAPVHLTLAEERTCLRIGAARAFPHSDHDRYIQIFEGKPDGGRGGLVGMLRDLSALQGRDREALDTCLARSYLVPRVLRILQAVDQHHVIHWVLETDRGRCEMDMRNMYKDVQRRSGGRVLLTDVHENRYEIPDIRKLDAQSRAWLDAYL